MDPLIIAHAAWPAAPEPASEQVGSLPLPPLPKLSQLLAWADGPPEQDAGSPGSLSPPHERILARELGLCGADGCLPWAGWWARRDGLDPADPADLAWGLLTPAHWQAGTDDAVMHDPADLRLDADTSRALLEAVRFLFEEEGWVLTWGAPLRWYVVHESLKDLPTASPDRVIGQPVGPWLPGQAAARLVRRLHNEVQMLLYNHPVNDRREAAGLRPVNAFWLSGCGVAQPEAHTGLPPGLHTELRQPALRQDLAAWSQAWQALDAGVIASALQKVHSGETVRLTLCGPTHAMTWTCRPGRWLTRWRQRWSRPDPSALLAALA